MNKKGKHNYTIKNYYKYLEQSPKTERGRGRKTSSYKNDHNFFPFLPLFNRTTALKRKCATASIEILRKAQHCLVGELAVVAVLREQAVSERIAA